MEERRGGLPPGYRFHPTDEELIHFYLKQKIWWSTSGRNAHDFEFYYVIPEVHLNQLEPWDIQEKCKVGASHQTEWYFFTHKDKKYTTGMRTNRATKEGFWKATGRDKPVVSSCATVGAQDQPRLLHVIGMRKTLVFYKGRAPHGIKSNWIMHEFRLVQILKNKSTTRPYQSQEDGGWVLCRIFRKSNCDERSIGCQVNSRLSDIEEPISRPLVKIYGETHMNNENVEPMVKKVMFCKEEFEDRLPHLESAELDPNIAYNNVYSNDDTLYSNLTPNDLSRPNLREANGSFHRKALQYAHHVSMQEYLVNQCRNSNIVDEVLPQGIENPDIQVYVDGATCSSYDNFIKVHGLEGNPVTNDNFFLPSGMSITGMQASLDNYASNNEIELWNFS